MKKATVYELESMLEENYQIALQGKKAKNILVYALDDYLPTIVIKKWAKKHADDFVLQSGFYPSPVYIDRGVLKEGYVYTDTQFNDNEKRVLYLELLNYRTTTPGRDEELLKVIRDDEYVNPVTNQKHSLKNRLFTVATALTSGSTELLPELKAQFDCYLHDDNDPENKEFFLKRLHEEAKVWENINWEDIIGNLSKDGDK